jgi:hypothetical protein
VVEADSIQALYQDDGESFSQITARGSALLTITPVTVTQTAERKRLRAEQFVLFFAEKGNRIRNFQAEGQVAGEFEPLLPGSRRFEKTLSGRKLNADFNQQTQDLAEAVVEGSVRFTEADRTATANRATWTGANQLVTLRGRPQLWDKYGPNRRRRDRCPARGERESSARKGPDDLVQS